MATIFDLSKRYNQRDEVVHLAVDLMDRFFLQKDSKFEFSQRNLALYCLTFYLIASKHDEIDDNIPLIKDLTRYFIRSLPTSVATPTFNEVVECERELMHFFKWDLMIVTPTLVLNQFLANGIVFDNEDIDKFMLLETVRHITDSLLSKLVVLVKELNIFRDKRPSLLAAALVYLARKEELNQ